MGFFSKKVEVTLIDDRSDMVMGVSKLAPEDLPESFFASTTLHLGNSDWSVVSADPMTRDQYAKLGRLRIRVRQIEPINPNELLYSLPTICDGHPASDGPEADGMDPRVCMLSGYTPRYTPTSLASGTSLSGTVCSSWTGVVA